MAAPSPLRGKTATRTVQPALTLLLLVLLLLITPAVHSRQLGLTSTISGQKGAASELRAWRKEGDVIRPDRTTDLAPPAPKPNSNVPGGPFG
ncbi:unnamed protein product [Urochloa decumbens]|uniref:Uncharacterized protein n=1 Tax=Urochloa decumbens TaxID=240449 RepID=A0ABC9EYV4_9POAL